MICDVEFIRYINLDAMKEKTKKKCFALTWTLYFYNSDREHAQTKKFMWKIVLEGFVKSFISYIFSLNFSKWKGKTEHLTKQLLQ